MKIEVVSIETFEKPIIQHLVSLLQDRFNADVKVRSSITLETLNAHYNASRNQYSATSILRGLKSLRIVKDVTLLGVIDVDLFVSGLNFVFGIADPISKVAVFSTTRLRSSFYGQKDEKEQFLERAGTEAVHELGHVFKLKHCDNPVCVMFFSNTLADTDRKKDAFCKHCQKDIEKYINEH